MSFRLKKQECPEIFDRKHRFRVLPKAFTEKGLYMLATILRSSSSRGDYFNY